MHRQRSRPGPGGALVGLQLVLPWLCALLVVAAPSACGTRGDSAGVDAPITVGAAGEGVSGAAAGKSAVGGAAGAGGVAASGGIEAIGGIDSAAGASALAGAAGFAGDASSADEASGGQSGEGGVGTDQGGAAGAAPGRGGT